MRCFVVIAAIVLRAALLIAQDPPLPPVAREFRGVWLATVANMDWPSRPGLSTWVQQQELLAILNRCVRLKLNTVIFHVRPGADAFYESPYEPWSQFLTGRQGRPPEPFWDPLAFAITEAHKRGLELHAWFNPFRAGYRTDSLPARTHITQTQPSAVHPYDRFVWMDPGDPAVRRRFVKVVTDVVDRYDVDGVHIDDYFYPYPADDTSGIKAEFPDSAAYARYVKSGGKLAKDDWRRRNVDQMIEAMFFAVRDTKPWVKVGVSPFGIWRPGNPPQIKGFDAYSQIYADSKKWLERGWLDYLVPQLYWPIAPPDQSYPVLLKWWVDNNPRHRHIWPGLASFRVTEVPSSQGVSANEIIDEIRATRSQEGATGHVHFNAHTLINDPDSLVERLIANVYQEPALVPATPWLRGKAPGTPAVTLSAQRATGESIVKLVPGGGVSVWLWTVRTLSGQQWTTEIIPGATRFHRLPVQSPARVVVTAVGRTGLESPIVDIPAQRADSARVVPRP